MKRQRLPQGEEKWEASLLPLASPSVVGEAWAWCSNTWRGSLAAKLLGIVMVEPLWAPAQFWGCKPGVRVLPLSSFWKNLEGIGTKTGSIVLGVGGKVGRYFCVSIMRKLQKSHICILTSLLF